MAGFNPITEGTGTVEELERKFSETLVHLVSGHREVKNTLERAKAEMKEASTAGRATARKKSGSQVSMKEPAGICNNPAEAPEAPTPAKVGIPKAASLFDSSPEPQIASAADLSASGGIGPSKAESQIDEDEESRRIHQARGGPSGRLPRAT